VTTLLSKTTDRVASHLSRFWSY